MSENTKRLREKVLEVLCELSNDERTILEMRFGILNDCPTTLEETSDFFDANREEVRAFESETLRKLRMSTLPYDDFVP